MRFIFFTVILLFMTNCLFSQDWELVWSDEFDGEILSLDKWEYMLGDGTDYGLPVGWGNNELEWYRSENVVCQDGKLMITAKKESFSSADYTSGRIRTRNKGDWTYGRFEFRIKMPIGQGIWPAIWLMPTDNAYGGWAASGEVDIIEYLGHEPNKVHGTLHYGGQWPSNTSSGKSYTLASGTFNEDFHTFAIEWEEGVFRWYVDGHLYQTQTSWYSTNGAFPAPFDKRFHLILNLAVGGNWPGNPNASTQFPQTLEIDYVRVYEKSSATGLNENKPEPPQSYSLFCNYPNPFNPSTRISFQLPKREYVRLSIMDIYGREIKEVISAEQNAGMNSVSVNLDGYAGGMYFCQMETPHFRQIRKMLLVK